LQEPTLGAGIMIRAKRWALKGQISLNNFTWREAGYYFGARS